MTNKIIHSSFRILLPLSFTDNGKTVKEKNKREEKMNKKKLLQWT